MTINWLQHVFIVSVSDFQVSWFLNGLRLISKIKIGDIFLKNYHCGVAGSIRVRLMIFRQRIGCHVRWWMEMPHHYNRVLIGNSRKREHNGFKVFLKSYSIFEFLYIRLPKSGKTLKLCNLVAQPIQLRLSVNVRW